MMDWEMRMMLRRGTEVMLTKVGIGRGNLKSALGPIVLSCSIWAAELGGRGSNIGSARKCRINIDSDHGELSRSLIKVMTPFRFGEDRDGRKYLEYVNLGRGPKNQTGQVLLVRWGYLCQMHTCVGWWWGWWLDSDTERVDASCKQNYRHLAWTLPGFGMTLQSTLTFSCIPIPYLDCGICWCGREHGVEWTAFILSRWPVRVCRSVVEGIHSLLVRLELPEASGLALDMSSSACFNCFSSSFVDVKKVIQR